MKKFSEIFEEITKDSKPDVWKTVETEYTSTALKHKNWLGSNTSAGSRKVTSWSARINGKVVRGFGTKRAAVAAVKEAEAALKP